MANVELQGMDALKVALKGRPRGENSLAWLAGHLGLSRSTPTLWKAVPAEYLAKIVEVTGMPARVLRPDLAELFDRA